MTGPAEVGVRMVATDVAVGAAMTAALRDAGIPISPSSGCPAGTVVLAAADTVDAAIRACHPLHPTLVVADRMSPAEVRQAVRAGVRALLRSADTSPDQLVAAVRSVRCGDGRLPHAALLDLLDAAPEPAAPAREDCSPLTVRQTTVVALMAEGHGNAAIARSLACSEHTVKNVIYDLMARLQARNRAHAVAHAVRAGLI